MNKYLIQIVLVFILSIGISYESLAESVNEGDAKKLIELMNSDAKAKPEITATATPENILTSPVLDKELDLLLNSAKKETDILSNKSENITSQASYLKVALASAFVLSLIFVLGSFIQKKLKGASLVSKKAPLDKLKIEQSLPLGAKRNLVVVSYNNKRMMVGVTPDSINFLSELSDQSNEFTSNNPNIDKQGEFQGVMKEILPQVAKENPAREENTNPQQDLKDSGKDEALKRRLAEIQKIKDKISNLKPLGHIDTVVRQNDKKEEPQVVEYNSDSTIIRGENKEESESRFTFTA